MHVAGAAQTDLFPLFHYVSPALDGLLSNLASDTRCRCSCVAIHASRVSEIPLTSTLGLMFDSQYSR